MIEFRLHEGRQQYRTWRVLFDPNGELHMYLDSADGEVWDRVDWTEWQDMPNTPIRTVEPKERQTFTAEELAFTPEDAARSFVGVGEKLADKINEVAGTPLEYHKDCFSMVIPMPEFENSSSAQREIDEEATDIKYPICQTCLYFLIMHKADGFNSTGGNCHLNPQPVEKRGHSWCGQWRSKA